MLLRFSERTRLALPPLPPTSTQVYGQGAKGIIHNSIPAHTGFALVFLDYVGNKVELRVDDPLREERHEATGQSNGDAQRDGQPAPDQLSLSS